MAGASSNSPRRSAGATMLGSMTTVALAEGLEAVGESQDIDAAFAVFTTAQGHP